MKSLLLLLVFTITAAAQVQAPMIAKPEDQAVIKPLVEAEKKAFQARDAKITTLPEAKAYRDAQEVLKQKLEALNKAVETLPEHDTWKQAGAATVDAAYQLQAKYQLSSREFRPELNDKGELVFVRIPKQ